MKTQHGNVVCYSLHRQLWSHSGHQVAPVLTSADPALSSPSVVLTSNPIMNPISNSV